MSTTHPASWDYEQLMTHLVDQHEWGLEPARCDVCGEIDAELYAFRSAPYQETKALCLSCSERAGTR